MKIIALTAMLIFFYIVSFSQANMGKSDSCTCEISIPLKAPEELEEDTISATVIVELLIDTNCICSNPVIIKEAGKARNESALDFANKYIAATKQCKRKCPVFHCKRGKKELPITFKVEED